MSDYDYDEDTDKVGNVLFYGTTAKQYQYKQEYNEEEIAVRRAEHKREESC